MMLKKVLVGLGILLSLNSCSKEEDVERYYTLRVEPQSGGSVSNNGVKSIAGAVFTLTASEGTTVTIKAYPEEGYLFDGWSDNTTDNPYTMTLDRDINLEAYFSSN